MIVHEPSERVSVLTTTNSGETREIGPKGLSIRHILAPFDGSPVAACTLPFLAAIAKPFSARVTLLRVLEHSVEGSVANTDALEWEMARAEARANLQQLEKRLAEQGCTASSEVVQGRVAEQIAHFAAQADVDLIVLSSHGAGGLHAWKRASTVHAVADITRASVLIVPAARFVTPPCEETQFHRILVPLDCSQRAECSLPAATELAKAHGAELVLAHMVTEPEMPRRLPPSSEDVELQARLVERNRSEARHYLRELQKRLSATAGKVSIAIDVSPRRSQALLEMAKHEGVDLVVLCAHGNSGDAQQRYGEVAARFLHESAVPVIVLQDLAHSGRSPAASEALATERQGH